MDVTGEEVSAGALTSHLLSHDVLADAPHFKMAYNLYLY